MGQTVSSGGELTVLPGQIEGGDIILNGGYQYVDVDGLATGTTVSSGGQEQVLGGVTEGTVLISGGETLYYGSAFVSGQSSATLFGFGSSIDTIIDSHGLEIVTSGCLASGTIISSGALDIDPAGYAFNTVVYRGSLNVFGGTAYATIVNNTGFEIVNGTTQSTTVSSGGVQAVHSAGTALNTTVSSGGNQSVDFGGTAIATTVYGTQDVNFSGIASAAILDAGGTQAVSSGGTEYATVFAGGTQTIFSGGFGNGEIIINGSQSISSGGVASDTTLSGGTQTVFAGGLAVSALVAIGTQNLSGGTAIGTSVGSTGTEQVYSGGLASNTTLNGGKQSIFSGGAVANTIIVNEGSQTVSYGGTATFDAVANGGWAIVDSGGTASSTTVSDGGTDLIDLGGIATSANVSSGGTALIWSGGTAIDSRINGGTLEVASGGTASDYIVFGSGGTLKIDATGGTLPATVSAFSKGDMIDFPTMSQGASVQLMSGNVLEVGFNSTASGHFDIQLDPTQDFSGDSFSAIPDGYGGTVIEVTSGMSINFFYDGFVPSSEFQSAMTYTANFLQQTFTNTLTLNVDVGFGTLAGGAMPAHALGASVYSPAPAYNYNQIKTALLSGEQSAAQQLAYSTLPATDPTSGGTFDIGYGEAKALNLIAGNSEATNQFFDGFIGFEGLLNFSYDPGVPAPANDYYFIGVAEHEITELMGRVGVLGSKNYYPDGFSVLDLFRYSSAGSNTLNTGGAGSVAYFSIDGGKTLLDSWNNNPSNGDLADWYPFGVAAGRFDAFDDGSQHGTLDAFTPTDIALMNALGWDTAAGLGVVTSGSSISGATIAAGNSLNIFNGGNATNVAVNSGGTENVYGNDTSATINNGGTQNVMLGGTASATLVTDPGLQIIMSGGTVIGAVLTEGEQDVYGIAIGTIVSSGGLQVVEGTSVISGTPTEGEGSAFSGTISGGTASGTTVSGGVELVYGVASGTTIDSGGSQLVETGGLASGSLAIATAKFTSRPAAR